MNRFFSGRFTIVKERLYPPKQASKKGAANLFVKILENHYGHLPKWVTEKITAASNVDLELWSLNILNVDNLEDIFKALTNNNS